MARPFTAAPKRGSRLPRPDPARSLANHDLHRSPAPATALTRADDARRADEPPSAFLAYVEQVLVPTLGPGDIVVMDNLPATQGGRLSAACHPGFAAQNLVLLPPYSPDFNPIENAFAKFKSRLRKAAAQNYRELGNSYRRRLPHLHTERMLKTTSRAAGYGSA